MKPELRQNGATLLIIIAFVILFFSLSEQASGKNTRIQVCKDGDHCITAEIAATPASRMKGLMYRKSLPDSHGMLFVYPRSDYLGFWMKNTKIPLDIVWLGRNKRIVHIVRDAQPCTSEPCSTYFAPGKAAYVLELAAGMSRKWKLEIGGRLIFEVPQDLISKLR